MRHLEQCVSLRLFIWLATKVQLDADLQPVMKSIIRRADELKLPFQELIDAFGFSDKFEGIFPQNSYIWLTLEHIWCSLDFRKEDVVKARNEYKELKALKVDIVDLASKLASKLQKQSELIDTTGFSKPVVSIS